MKKNHDDIAAYINKAIQACGYDDAFSETKRYLAYAINSVSKVSKKRVKKETQRQYYEDLAKKKKDEWWDMIKENAKKISVDKINNNIKKYDVIYINDGSNSERISVIGVNKDGLYVKDPLLTHFVWKEIQKQIIYNIPIIYSGTETNIYGILYVDEKITDNVIVDIDILVV